MNLAEKAYRKLQTEICEVRSRELYFPEHKVCATLQHNDHKSGYESVFQYLANRESMFDFKDEEQRTRSIETDELWTMQWYPHTPNGFIAIAAPTLQELLAFAKEHE